MKSSEIRQKFLSFFERNGHTIVPSSSLIPAEDPTLLFTNAGMNQFKDVFLGKEKRSYTRAASMQKCVRAGGKHNDLEQVGFTERHLTFFEMMGNFSFGDYFKREAIKYAWEFLTVDMGLPKEKLYPTVFRQDDEAFDLWHEVTGIAKEKITRLGEEDNFWQMGDTGPCGPCSEIFIDRGENKGCTQASCAPGCECERFTEIWNLVFMQFNRQEDGELKPLTQTGVDTGMGFERLCMVMQDKDTVFDISLFEDIYKAIEKLSGISYASADRKLRPAFRVLADHIRSASLIIADGGTPSNDGRGYVLRKIIRRAAIFAQKIKDAMLFAQLGKYFIDANKHIWPELEESRDLILSLLEGEIRRFSANLIKGEGILERYIEETVKEGSNELSGERVFKLYDTYGFPPELSSAVARERNMTTDFAGYEKEMAKQQEQSGKKVASKEKTLDIPEDMHTTFVGYELLETKSPIQFVAQEDKATWIVMKDSPFYVESGGQVNDKGWVRVNGTEYPVLDLKKYGDRYASPAIAIKLDTSGISTVDISVGDQAHSLVDERKRMDTVRNHTATHLLQAALMEVLGPQIKQAGSLVHEDYLRFDFNHTTPMTPDEIKKVEDLVNDKIMDDIHTEVFHTNLADAKKRGVISFFGEKYNPEEVRVVMIPGFSAELCGGTHARSTGIIGAFKITSETALATGVRRLVAITGHKAIEVFQERFSVVKNLCEYYKSKPHELFSIAQKTQERIIELQKDIKKLKRDIVKTQIPAWHEKVTTVAGVPHLYLELEDMEADDLKSIATSLSNKQPGFYFLISKLDGGKRIMFLGHVAKDLQDKLDVKDLGVALKEVGLRGGGKGGIIQGGGGKIPEGIQETLTSWLESKK